MYLKLCIKIALSSIGRIEIMEESVAKRCRMEAAENMEEDPLELGMKCKPQEKYVLYVVNYFLYGSAF